MIRFLVLLAFFLATIPSGSATTFVWMSAKMFLEQSVLIAVVEVAPVHEVTTPEGFRLQSAKAKIVREIFRRHPAVPMAEAKSIIIYSLDRNAAVAEDNIIVDGMGSPIREGKAFVCLKMKGFNKFYPYEPLCFQTLDRSENVLWPSEPVFRIGMDLYTETPLSVVIDQLDRLQKEK